MQNIDKPAPVPVQPANIPDELKTGKQFVLWRWKKRDEGWTKPPYRSNGRPAKSNDPGTWATFDEVKSALENGKFDGIGRCFAEDDPWCAFDLDKCSLSDGSPAPWAKKIIDGLGSYSEVTPSGNGFRVWVKAEKPGPKSGKGDIEIYDKTSKRYLCLTGHALNGHRTIEARQNEVEAIYSEIFEPPASDLPETKKPPQTSPENSQVVEQGLFVWDGDIARLPVKQETKSAILNGFAKGDRSEAMMGVLNALVWANLTNAQITEVFEQYAIGEKYREKGPNREQWLQPQIEKARARVTDRAVPYAKPAANQVTGTSDSGTIVPKSAKRTLTVCSLSEIHRVVLEDKPIAKGFISEEDALVIHSPGGIGKSLLILNVALALSIKVLSLWGRFSVPKERTTLFIQSENGRLALHQRARKMCEGVPALEAGLGNIFFAGENDSVTLSGAISEAAFQEKIYRCADEVGQPIDIIVFDPLISYHDADENDNSRMRSTLDSISEVSNQLKATPVVIHHDNRQAEIRGASAVRDWARSVVGLKDGGSSSGRKSIKLVHEKSNNCELFKSFFLQLDEYLVFQPVEGSDAMDPKLQLRCEAVKNALILQGSAVDTQKVLIDQYTELTGLKSTSTIRRHIDEAVSNGFINCEVYEEGGVKKCRYHI